MSVIHDFNKSLKWSHEQEDQPFWVEVYAKAFPTMVNTHSTRADGWAQRGGIDRTIMLEDGTVITVDEKVRAEKWPDILIEHWSDLKRQVPGWGHREKSLTCDYIAYAMIPSQICYLLPYQVLRRTIKLNGETWWNKAHSASPEHRDYRVVKANNGNYWTYSYTVPIETLLDAIRDCLIVTWEGNNG
jgi:hypothetical protein